MVRALSCLTFAAMLSGSAAEPSEGIVKLTLVERGLAPRYTIVLPADPSPSQTFAALELRKYVREMTDVTLTIATNVTPARGIFLGNGLGGRTVADIKRFAVSVEPAGKVIIPLAGHPGNGGCGVIEVVGQLYGLAAEVSFFMIVQL